MRVNILVTLKTPILDLLLQIFVHISLYCKFVIVSTVTCYQEKSADYCSNRCTLVSTKIIQQTLSMLQMNVILTIDYILNCSYIFRQNKDTVKNSRRYMKRYTQRLLGARTHKNVYIANKDDKRNT